MKKASALKSVESKTNISSELQKLKAATSASEDNKLADRFPYIIAVAFTLMLALALFPISIYSSTHNAAAETTDIPIEKSVSVEEDEDADLTLSEAAAARAKLEAKAKSETLEASDIQPTAKLSEAESAISSQTQSYFKGFELTPADGHAKCASFSSIDALNNSPTVLYSLALLSLVLIPAVALAGVGATIISKHLKMRLKRS